MTGIFKIVVLLAAMVQGQAQQALMVGHAEYKDKAACETAMNGDETTTGSLKKLVKDLEAQGITAVPMKADCIDIKDLPGNTPA